MNMREIFDTLFLTDKVQEVADCLSSWSTQGTFSETPFGDRENNVGSIEVASDAARSGIERITNAQDAILEFEHEQHNGTPECWSPREAADAWLGVPAKGGLAKLSPKERQDLSQNIVVRLEPGEGAQSRCLSVIDRGSGITSARMPETILSLNQSNKIRKHYLAGTYGQGGSSTLAFSKFVFIASRTKGNPKISFTLVRYNELPADEFKTGHYVYALANDIVPEIDAEDTDFEHGTIVKHFGYDLSRYSSSIGPQSLYGALQRNMFDPVTSIRLENKVHGWNRTIKGARNALNGAVDQGDADAKGPDLDYNLPLFTISLGDHGDIGIEYWVLSRPSGKKIAKPSRAFVNDSKPIILSHNGQNQGELSGTLIRKDADLPYLQIQGRLIVHVNCDKLSPGAKRLLFSSTREQSREGFMQTLIQDEVISTLKSDDQLRILNDKARDQSLREKDENEDKRLRKQVARLLRVSGASLIDVSGKSESQDGGEDKPKPKPKPKPQPIEIQEPPTFIRIVCDEDKPIKFYAGQRKYVRIETNANSIYHDPDNPSESKINVAVGDDLALFGTSPLNGGRMRIGLEAAEDVAIGTSGSIRVELYRPGHSTLSDESPYEIKEKPEPKTGSQNSNFPQFEIEPVDGPDDENWEFVTAGSDTGGIADHASGWQMNEGILYIYYSTVFPRFSTEKRRLEQRNPAFATSFVRRYELWLAVHALLMHDDDEKLTIPDSSDIGMLTQMERCRIASIVAMMASQEVQNGIGMEDEAA